MLGSFWIFNHTFPIKFSHVVVRQRLNPPDGPNFPATNRREGDGRLGNEHLRHVADYCVSFLEDHFDAVLGAVPR